MFSRLSRFKSENVDNDQACSTMVQIRWNNQGHTNQKSRKPYNTIKAEKRLQENNQRCSKIERILEHYNKNQHTKDHKSVPKTLRYDQEHTKRYKESQSKTGTTTQDNTTKWRHDTREHKNDQTDEPNIEKLIKIQNPTAQQHQWKQNKKAHPTISCRKPTHRTKAAKTDQEHDKKQRAWTGQKQTRKVRKKGDTAFS